MRFLVDNNVPRSVTHLLNDRGHEGVEVRSTLGQDAADDAVAAYAAARRLVVVTHDRGLARRCLRGAIPHLWLRTREPQDRDRLAQVIDEIVVGIDAGAARVLVFATVIRIGPAARG